jgi:hypothetical protein
MDFVITFVREFITLFSEMAPFLLLGFLLAGVIHVWIPNALYVPKISKSNFSSVLWAALFGVPLPICSCGVIPTSIAIRREGASKGASVSFLISTPATGVDSILATYSLLGLPFAILRPIAAFVTALVGGVFTNFATRNEPAEASAKASHHESAYSKSAHSHSEHSHSGKCSEHHHEDHCSASAGTSTGSVCHSETCCCSCESVDVHSMNFGQKIVETFRYGLVDMVGNVSKWLMIGLLLGALIAAFVPNDFFMALREYPLLCMIAILLLAMPMYTCATGSIPLALALVAKGITPGAALVLLMAGPATSIASMLVVGKAFGKRTLIAYLVSIAVGAIGFGFIVDTFFMDTFLSAMLPGGAAECLGHEVLGVFDYICAGLLALLILYTVVTRKAGHCGDSHCNCGDHHDHCDCDDDDEHNHAHEHHEPTSKTYRVNGMNCSHCKACVEKAAFALEGVVFAVANVAKKELVIEGSVDESALKTAIEEAGFEFGGEI